VSPQEWGRFCRDEDIPFTLKFESILSYRIYRNIGEPGGPVSFQYMEEIEITSLEDFGRDASSDRWKKGMDDWYRAGGATWFLFYPTDVAGGGETEAA
jgi:hypothetical protein